MDDKDALIAELAESLRRGVEVEESLLTGTAFKIAITAWLRKSKAALARADEYLKGKTDGTS